MLTAGVVLAVMGSLLMVARAQAPPTKVVRAGAGAVGAVTSTATATAISTTPVAATGSPALIAYEGLGAWVSLYDYDLTSQPINPATTVAAMASEGVQTLYLQTSRWNLSAAFDNAPAAGQFIDDAHAAGMRVVGWYLPGFANNSVDVARSQAALAFTTPKGGHLDGLALDIEDKSNFGSDITAFDDGVTSFSDALRAAVGPGVALGAIVPDAVNDERAPSSWAGFPWAQIAHDYDVVIPMGYWSVTKPSSDCGRQDDAGAYTTDVYNTTISLMGTTKPMLVVGGVGDCDTLAEVQAYVAATKVTGELGASIYSYETVQQNPAAASMWQALAAARH